MIHDQGMESSMHRGIGNWLLLPLLAALGCDGAPPQQQLPEQREEAGAAFEPHTAGTIRGQVIWDGEIPTVAPLEVLPNPLAGPALQKKQVRPNPNVPRIDAGTRGVASAVVFLRGIDSRRGKRWDYPPVRVEQRAGQIHLVQGDTASPVAFVQSGDSIEMVSGDPFFHSLHAGGAAFFTLTFPAPSLPLKRPLREKGIVELTSAAGYFWMRAYLFVDDHPYYALTDSVGRFILSQVPPGNYDVVCWTPNWIKARHERDPESGFVARLFFKPPVCRVQTLVLGAKETKELAFVLSAEMFSLNSAPCY
jgi:hypothetical protein